VDGIVFRVADALNLSELGRTFDTVIDSGVFHVFSDQDRARYVQSLASVLNAGGTLFILVFSDREPSEWGGPRRIAEADFARTFTRGWRIASIEPEKFETNFDQHQSRGGGEAWLAKIERTTTT
jgi:SAM-dependent methyltransferase